jgi:hypothetical protein
MLNLRNLFLLWLLLPGLALAQSISNIAVSYTPASPRVGEPYTATVTVTATGPATPAGTVLIFFSGNPERCTTGALVGSGVTATASCTLLSSTVGTKALEAFYLPGNYGTAPGANVPVTIQQATTSLALKVLPDPSTRNRVFVQALVQPDVGTPTGTYTFTSGPHTCSAPPGENWCSLLPDQSSTTPVVGVAYSGDANFSAATASTPITVTDLPWLRRVVSAPLPDQSTDPYSNAMVIDGFDAGGWSNDGRYYVFATSAALVPVDTNGIDDIYLWDERNRSTKLLSYGPDTFTPANDSSQAPRISGDGRFVVFETAATNLIAGDTNAHIDIIRQDVQTGARIRVTPNGANGSARGADISTDGRYVSFVSDASNLVAGDANTLPDAFRADLQTTSILRVSVSGPAPGTEGNNLQSTRRGVSEAAISGDGQQVAFLTDFTNGDFFAGNSTISQRRPFLRNLGGGGSTSYVSTQAATLPSVGLSISKDSFPTVVWSTGQALLTPDTNGQIDIYARQLPSGPLQLISSSAGGIVGDNGSGDARISADASVVVFSSSAKNLAAGIDYNAVDIYAKTLATGAIRRINVRDGTVATQSTQQFQLAGYPAPNGDASRISFQSTAIDLSSTNGALGNRLLFLRAPASQQTRAIARRPIGGRANAESFNAALSANAGVVAYATAASNLIAGVNDTNGVADVYLSPGARSGSTAWLMSRTPGGQAGNGISEQPSVSAGTTPRVAFQSDASDLVAGDSNGVTDIFIADPTGPLRRVSISSGGVQANASSLAPDLSADGERVVFQSNATNLVAGASTNQAYLHELSGSITTLISRASGSGGAIANTGSFGPRISSNGQVAVFLSDANNLVSGVTLNAAPNAYLRELQAPFTTRIVSVDTAGTATGNGGSFEVAVDATGSKVAFVTSASNLLAGDTNNRNDVYVRDMASGVLTRASLDPSGNQFTAPALGISLSDDGRYVGFMIDRAFGADGGSFGDREAYVRDLQTGMTVRVDQTTDLNPPNGSAIQLALSGNGAYVALVSRASNLVPGDLNAQADTFLLRNPLAPLPATLQITSNGPTVTGQPILVTVRLQGEFGVEPRPRGNVTVISTGGESCTITDIAALDASVSQGTCTLSGPLPPGTRTLAASYAPTGTLPDRYAPTTGSVTHAVNPGSVTLSNGFGSGTPVVGQTITFSVGVAAATPAAGTPTGTVTVSVGGGVSGGCTITLPANNCAITFTNAGSGSVTFNYSGDANFLPAVNSAPITVARANTSITGSFTPGSPQAGTPVNFNANLNVLFPGNGTPTGQIFVTASGGLAGDCTITLPATSCPITFAGPGSGTVSFGYAGDANFAASSSTPLPITVVPISAPTVTAISTVTPTATTVGNAYTVTVAVSSNSGTPTAGTVSIGTAGFADSCTITLPGTSCTIPATQTALPGVRNLIASYSGTTGFDASVSAPRAVVVAAGSTLLSSPILAPGSVVTGEPFTATGTLANPVSASTLTPSGTLTAQVLPLGNQVSCTLSPQSPGVAAYRCAGLSSPIAAAKLVDLRYAGSTDLVFPAAQASATQPVTRAPTQTRILADTPDPSAPGQSVTVSVEVRAAAPSLAPSAGIGAVQVSDGVDSCSFTLPASSCSLSLSTAGLRTLTATYAGDANFLPSSGSEPHTVTGGVADVSVSKRNNLSVLPGGSAVRWLIEVRNAGPAGTSVLLRDPVPTGLSSFSWTCAASSGSQCSSSVGMGPLQESVTIAPGGLVSYLLTATVQASPELSVRQLATVELPAGVSDPNPANNQAIDEDRIGVFGAGFESSEAIPLALPPRPDGEQP